MKISTLRLLALVAAEDFALHQMDMKTAFLIEDLKVEIFMEQPKRWKDEIQPDC